MLTILALWASIVYGLTALWVLACFIGRGHRRADLDLALGALALGGLALFFALMS